MAENYDGISIRLITETVAAHFGIDHGELLSERRYARAARARQIAAGLARRLTPKSTPRIGRAMGGRDHTTIVHALRRFDERSDAEPAFVADAMLIEKEVRAAYLALRLLKFPVPADDECIDPIEVAGRITTSGSQPIIVSREELLALAEAVSAEPQPEREERQPDREEPPEMPPIEASARELMNALQAQDGADFADRGSVINARNRVRRARAALALVLDPDPAEQRRTAS